MPLRATVDGKDMLAPLLSEAEWEKLSSRARGDAHPLLLACCGASGHCRTSKLGTRHFVHPPRGACSWQPETAEHLLAKEAIVRGCRAAGLTAIPECSEKEWRADVLAVKNAVRIAFEIQWSSQTLEVTRSRQSRYAEANVRGCWFFRKIPSMLVPQKEIPAFVLRFKERIPIVDIGQRSLALTEFTESLLTRKVRFCEFLTALPKQKARIVIAAMECWKCRTLSTVHYIDEGLRSGCGREISVDEGLWTGDKIEFLPAIREAVASHIIGANRPKLGHIKRRFSAEIGRAYTSFGCANCDAIFGDWHVDEFILENRSVENREIIDVDIILPRQYSAPIPHWCFAENSKHCIAKEPVAVDPN